MSDHNYSSNTELVTSNPDESNDLNTIKLNWEIPLNSIDSNLSMTTQENLETPINNSDDSNDSNTVHVYQEITNDSADSNESSQNSISNVSKYGTERQEFHEEFIELYRSLPELWNPKNKRFRKRRARTRAYKKLAMKLKENNTESDIKLAMLKVNSLKQRYRQQLAKVLEFKQNGIEFVPTVWWYKKLSFLGDISEQSDKNSRKLSSYESKIKRENKRTISSDVQNQLSTKKNYKEANKKCMDDPVKSSTITEISTARHKNEQQFWEEFIKLYECLPQLWNPKNRLYQSNYAKDMAYKILTEKLKLIIKNANEVVVKQKITSMLCSYCCELNYISSSGKLPRLWYFKRLSFLETIFNNVT